MADAPVTHDLIVISDDTTIAGIWEAIKRVLESMRRLPAIESYQESGHRRINQLLDELEARRLIESAALAEPVAPTSVDIECDGA